MSMAGVWISGWVFMCQSALEGGSLVPVEESEGSGESPACYMNIRQHVPFLFHPWDVWGRSA